MSDPANVKAAKALRDDALAVFKGDLEIAKLADSLGMLMDKLGGDNPLVKQILDGQSPTARAAALIDGSKLTDVSERKRIAAGGAKAIAESKDPMILLAKQIDPRSRELRKIFEEEIEEPQRQAYAKIAAARFAVLGSSTYPDATFTLRLSFGAVRGYAGGRIPAPPLTRLARRR